ncbi:ATP-binding protein [Cohnella panacarvi]|uniref:ATP-binding protein n=1 Tax=Cohnella panacarvi TaxID=400776 RepID=UPI00047E1B67|nr:ATP-binding protein [Cohnella panacarvi]
MEVISGKVAKAKKVVIYGPEGIGKSSFAARFPRPIFIDTEGSTTEMDVDRLPKPSSWEMLRQQVVWVKQQNGRFGSLVIDTIDWAEMLAVNSICAAHNKAGVEDFSYGKGYIYVAEEIGRFLNLLSDIVESGIHVVLIAHAQIIKFEQPDEMGAYDRYQLKLGQKTGSRTAPLVKEWADMVLFINYKTFSVATDDKGKKNKAQGGARTVYATHHPAWDAKNRHGLPDDFPLDYSHIAHIFTSPVASQSPTQEQPPALSTQAPAATPSLQQVQKAEAVANTPSAGELNPKIPQALRDLMIEHQVKETDIQLVVSQKGYYPYDTPIENYDPNFINGVLVSAWPQVFSMIEQARKDLPF